MLCLAAAVCFISIYAINRPGAGSVQQIFNFTASYQVPDDIDTNASDTALAAYAWQEFLALNWKSSFDSSGIKSEPDASWSYAYDTSSQTATVV